MAKLTAEHDYTDAELLRLFREAKAFASQGKAYSIGGRSYTRQDLPTINANIAELERRISAAAGKSTVVIGRHARRV